MSLGVNKDVLYAWRDEQREGKLDGANIFTADRGLEVQRGAPPFPLLEDQVYRPTNVEDSLGHTPPEILSKNLGLPESVFATFPKSEVYIVQGKYR
jgi:hypothetical protein